jgi:hypothetical protein
MAELICETCGNRGPTKTHTKGSILIEIVLWLCFLLPGLIYSIWRLTTRTQVCRVCGSPTVIPINTPKGRELAERYKG